MCVGKFVGLDLVLLPMRPWRTRTRTGRLKEAVFQRVREVLFLPGPLQQIGAKNRTAAWRILKQYTVVRTVNNP